MSITPIGGVNNALPAFRPQATEAPAATAIATERHAAVPSS